MEDRLNATAPPLDLFSLPATLLLDTKQVGSLGYFGSAATLEHNRSVGRPGPKYLRVSGRIFYRVSDLLAYLAHQEAASEREQAERRDKYAKRSRRPIADEVPA